MAFEFQFTRRVEFGETDMAGIMHFSNFFRYMEATETAFMRSLGLSVVLSRSGINICLPRVHAECDYATPLHFEDEVLVRLLVEKKGTRSLTYQFRFYTCVGSLRHQVAVGRLTLVCASRKLDGKLQSVPLPKVMSDQIQEAPAELLAGGEDRPGSPVISLAHNGHPRRSGTKRRRPLKPRGNST